MTALKNYRWLEIKQYEPAKSSLKKNLSCEWKKKARALKLFLQSSSVQDLMLYFEAAYKGIEFWTCSVLFDFKCISFSWKFMQAGTTWWNFIYGNSSKFLFSNLPGLALFYIACKKFSIWSKNQIFGFDPEIFYQIKLVSRFARPRATQPGHWYFWFFSTFLLRNAHIWPPKRFLRFKTTKVDYQIGWN